MIAYILEGVGPQQADKDPRMARLMGAGPWQYQMHRSGCLATWKTAAPVPRSQFGDERKTVDGLTYLGPLKIPTPAELFRPSLSMRNDLHQVMVAQDMGVFIRILPAYMSPRQILEDNTLGDPTTAYGKAVRSLMGRLQSEPELTFNDVIPEMAECCRLAAMYSYRVTRELLTDTGWLNEESMLGIWRASIEAPKADPASGGGT